MWKGDIRLIALHACGLQPYYYHDVRGDVTMQKSQRITTSCDLWDNFPESNSKPRVDVGLKSNFCDSSHFFCDPMTQVISNQLNILSVSLMLKNRSKW